MPEFKTPLVNENKAGEQRETPAPNSKFTKFFDRFAKHVAAGAFVASIAAGGMAIQGCAHGNVACAARDGDIASVEKILQEKGDPNAVTDASGFQDFFESGKTALMYAAERGDITLARLLIKNGADVNKQKKNEFGHTALCFAAEMRNFEMIDFLIQNGADVNLGNPLLYFAKDGDAEVVRYLLEKGADPSIRDDWGVTALMHVSCADREERSIWLESDLKIMELLIQNGADVNERSVPYLAVSGAATEYYGGGETPLMFAVGAAAMKKTKFLIENGADVNARDDEGMTPLMHNRSAFFDIMDLLLQNGADPKKVDKEGNTLLMHMSAARQLEGKIMYSRHPWMLRNELGGEDPDPLKTISFLLRNGAEVNAEGKSRQTALMGALNNENWGIAKMLLDNGANPLAKDAEGRSAFSFVYPRGELPSIPAKLVEHLIKAGADVNAKGRYGITALHALARYPRDNYEAAELLVRNGANPNAKDDEGKNPLFYLVENNAYTTDRDGPDPDLKSVHKLARLLLEKGSEANIRDEDGRTMLYYAKEDPGHGHSRDEELIKILEQYGAKQ